MTILLYCIHRLSNASPPRSLYGTSLAVRICSIGVGCKVFKHRTSLLRDCAMWEGFIGENSSYMLACILSLYFPTRCSILRTK